MAEVEILKMSNRRTPEQLDSIIDRVRHNWLPKRNPSMSEHYAQLYHEQNKQDREDRSYFFIAYGLMVLSGFVVGVIFGYGLGIIFPWS